MYKKLLFAGMVCAIAALWSWPAFGFGKGGVVGAVYTMTNDAAENAVIVYDRMHDGTLQYADTVPTGGIGLGSGLGTQGAIVLNKSDRLLLVANAGSDDISVFDLKHDRLDLVGRFPSGGDKPASIAVDGRLVYVLNTGTPNNVTGFELSKDGQLIPIAGSTRSLSGPDTAPAQVEFSPDGDMLVVTEKGTNLIDVFPVDRSGMLGARVSTVSNGMTPFGFAFGKRNQLFVSEAFGGAMNASAVSSYVVEGDGHLTLVTGSALTLQTAACWTVVDKSGRFTYVTNTGSSNVTGFRISNGGDLSGLGDGGVTGTTPSGSQPIDEDFSNDGRFLYVLSTGGGITVFRAGPDGSLSSVENVGAPAGAVGLVVR